jgi:hypothetical protein
MLQWPDSIPSTHSLGTVIFLSLAELYINVFAGSDQLSDPTQGSVELCVSTKIGDMKKSPHVYVYIPSSSLYSLL